MPVRTISAPVPALAFSSVRSGNTDPGRRGRGPRRRTGRPPGTPGGSSQRSGAATNSGYTVRRGARRSPGLGHRPQPVEGGPGPLGVHVVGGHRRHPAPVVDAGVEQHAEVVGQVGQGLDVDAGRQDQAGQGDGVEVLVRRARGARAWRCPAWAGSSGRSPPARGRGGGASRRWPPGRPAGPPGLADADQDAGGEGDAQAPGGLERGQPALGVLSGSPGGRPGRPAGSRPSSPGWAPPAAAAPARARGGRRRWRGGAGPCGRAPAGTSRSGRRPWRRSRGRRATARRRVALLGALAQREEGLVAAGLAPAWRWRARRRGTGRPCRGGPAAGRTCSSRSGRGTAW